MVRYIAVHYTSPDEDYDIWMGVVKISNQDSPALRVKEHAIDSLKKINWDPEDIMAILDGIFFFWVDPGAAAGLSKLKDSNLLSDEFMDHLCLSIAELFRVNAYFGYQENWTDEIDIMLEDKPDEVNHYLKDCLGKVTKEEQ